MAASFQNDQTLHMDDCVFDEKFLARISSVTAALAEMGYDPYSQLTGYLTTGNDLYITRFHDARALVKELDREKLQKYVAYLKTGNIKK